MMNETLLIFKNGPFNKYWRIITSGNTLEVTYGKVGSVRSVKRKRFSNSDICRRESEKQIKSKLEKGYVVVQSSFQLTMASTMNEELFWELLELCKQNENSFDEQQQWLVEQLTKKTIKDLVVFDFIFSQQFRKSFTSDLWAASFIATGVSTDECFDGFRAWMITLGKEAYEAAIKDPETLLPYLEELREQGEQPQQEEILDVASLAYEEKTGLDEDAFYNLYNQYVHDLYLDPVLQFDWNEFDHESLKRKFPKLWDVYGEKPFK
ncbi:DUF4240 domain-containing protein [Bacillus sp. MRMR6]|uniref:DUF4240 domain-containing protein n=1 Tax=Bacillus sp. MRMR6 TaxID=1928617 RepID=UPI000952B7D5|nr:DUF4240 domain-containing protein [Bacillus sp. MRMR6]OLS41112.1 hypothetical protein BTR25_04395 [Bacillus sp. MRMR6]